ncbi:MAG TPA: ribonuclease H-like domain-containing protein [Oscillatoriaceae cyanobacterium]
MALYLDVETTYQGKLTVIGLHHAGIGTVQLVGPEITTERLLDVLPMAICVYTYNGDRFDLPIIKAQLGVDLKQRYRSVDLMHLCHRAKLYGGLKRVEERLGIGRKLTGLSGKDAVALWYQYEKTGDEEALATLLAYNREDVENLHQLREALEMRFAR